MDVSGGRLTLPELLDAFGKIAWLAHNNFCTIILMHEPDGHCMISHYSMDRDAKWLAWFEQQFSNLAGSDRQIDLEEFKEALHVKEVSMVSRVNA